LKLGEEKAANDWWWAVDNINVGVPPFTYAITNSGVGFSARIAQVTAKTVDQSKEWLSSWMDSAVTSTVDVDGERRDGHLYADPGVCTGFTPHGEGANTPARAGASERRHAGVCGCRVVDVLPSPTF
jgi:hypothetical protein